MSNDYHSLKFSGLLTKGIVLSYYKGCGLGVGMDQKEKAIVLKMAFENEDAEIQHVLLQPNHARAMVVDVIAVLKNLDDPVAKDMYTAVKAVFEKHFPMNEESEESDGDRSDTAIS